MSNIIYAPFQKTHLKWKIIFLLKGLKNGSEERKKINNSKTIQKKS